MKRPGAFPLRTDLGGAVALEFALVSLVFLPLCIGILETGLALWTQNSLQTAADLTARCVALDSPACSDPQQYAVAQSDAWALSLMNATADVSVSASGSCNGAPGSYATVTITQHWSGLPAILPTNTFRASACYPINNNGFSDLGPERPAVRSG